MPENSAVEGISLNPAKNQEKRGPVLHTDTTAKMFLVSAVG